MAEMLKRRSLTPVLAVSVVALLALALVLLSSGGSKGAAVGTLAGYMPPDSVVYVQTDLKPGAEARAEVDRAVRRLTGNQLTPAIDDLFDRFPGGIDFRTEVEPWLSGPVAVATGGSREGWGLAAAVDDTVAAREFVDGLQGEGDIPGGGRVGIIGGTLVAAGSDRQLDRMAAAIEGDSLAATDAFEQMSAQFRSDGVADVFINNGTLLDTLADYGDKRGEDPAGMGFDAGSLIEALGIEPEGTGTAMSLLVEGDRISLVGKSGLKTGVVAGDASSLIGSFPAGTVLAAGTSGVGEGAGELLDALKQAGDRSDDSQNPGGIPDAASPGATDGLGGVLDKTSVFGIDFRGVVASLDTAGVFVTGNSPETMRGAIVATSSDPELIRDSVDRISSFGALAGGDFLKPLPAGLDGFSIVLPGVPGGRVAFGYSEDKLAIGLGVATVRQALKPAGRTLADTGLFRQADDSLSVGGLNLFVRPAALAPLIRQGAASFAARLARFAAGIQSVAGGSDDGSFELDLNLRK